MVYDENDYFKLCCVQATNFLRAFRTMSQVSALGLVLHDIDENRNDFPRLIQSWQRFVIMQVHKVGYLRFSFVFKFAV